MLLLLLLFTSNNRILKQFSLLIFPVFDQLIQLKFVPNSLGILLPLICLLLKRALQFLEFLGMSTLKTLLHFPGIILQILDDLCPSQIELINPLHILILESLEVLLVLLDDQKVPQQNLLFPKIIKPLLGNMCILKTIVFNSQSLLPLNPVSFKPTSPPRFRPSPSRPATASSQPLGIYRAALASLCTRKGLDF